MEYYSLYTENHYNIVIFVDLVTDRILSKNYL